MPNDCQSHHYACDCREALFSEYEKALIEIYKQTKDQPVGSLAYKIHLFIHKIL